MLFHKKSGQIRGIFKYFADAPKKNQTSAPANTSVAQESQKQTNQPSRNQSNSVAGDPKVRPKIEDYADFTYKKYPHHLSHYNPQSKDYIHSERDEYRASSEINAHNNMIDQLKRDIKLQEKVHEYIKKLDRPWLRRELESGNTQNVFKEGVKNYALDPKTGFAGEPEKDELLFDEYMKNENRFLNQTVFKAKHPRLSNEVEWLKELDQRPVNSHYHPDKGYKYDVEVPYDQRFPHVADRLGYPETLGTPLERLLRLEGDIFHPQYLDQPFVQTPSANPHPSLNFEEGEVIYENWKLVEWAKLINRTGFSALALLACFAPYQLIFKTHMPLKQAMDSIFLPYYQHTTFFFDSVASHIPVTAGVVMYASYLVLSFTGKMFDEYVVKMQYNKDKELVFVTKLTCWGGLREEVHETQHLEILPPSVRAGFQYMSSNDQDGLIDVACTNTQKHFVLYKDPKYWNTALNEEFLSKVTNLWTKDLIEMSLSERIQYYQTQPRIVIGEKNESFPLPKHQEQKKMKKIKMNINRYHLQNDSYFYYSLDIKMKCLTKIQSSREHDIFILRNQKNIFF